MKSTLITILILIKGFCFAQTDLLEHCGLDKDLKLTEAEITYLDKVFFDRTSDHKKGFDFIGKNVVFFTCGDAESEDGFITKDVFFKIMKAGGHRRPRGIFILDDEQKRKVAELDAIIMIDCKLYSEGDLIATLMKQNE
jgi:hypothetical protein